MNPEPLTSAGWADTGWTIKLLWISLGLAISAATAFVTAHAVIPSATDSGTLPASLRKLRPIFYLAGIMAVICIVIAVLFAIDSAGYLEGLYPRRFR